MIALKKITWEEILPMWQEHLSNMSLETNSAMSLLNDRKLSEDTENPIWIDVHSYDLQNMETTPTFWGAFHNDKLVGVNSGHMCLNKLYRSRGLFVLPEYRNLMIAQKLLMKTISQASHEKAIACWSYPKQSVEQVYRHQGFTTSGKEFFFNYDEGVSSKGETTLNIKAVRVLKEKEFDAYCVKENR